MQDRDLYAKLLGIVAPWGVEDVELDMKAREVVVHVAIVDDGADAYVGASFQHVGSRYTQPSDQENNPRSFVSGLPFGGATGNEATVVDLKLPSYDYVNLSAGIDFDNGLGVMVYVNNLFDENALLSFDRERGGRARLGFNIGQPRIIGVTVRKRFGN